MITISRDGVAGYDLWTTPYFPAISSKTREQFGTHGLERRQLDRVSPHLFLVNPTISIHTALLTSQWVRQSIGSGSNKDAAMNNAFPNRRAFRLSHIVLLLLISWADSRGASSFTGVGLLPRSEQSIAKAISSDGKIVAGQSIMSDGSRKTFRWTATEGMTLLPKLPAGASSEPRALSWDGSIIMVVTYADDGGIKTYRWTAAEGAVVLAGLPGDTASAVNAISSDGSVMVGLSGPPTKTQAFIWTAAAGKIGLGYIPGSKIKESEAIGVSSNGKIVVGRVATDVSTHQSFRWTATGGMVFLKGMAGAFNVVAHAVSADGSVVAGALEASSGRQAFCWTTSGGIKGIGNLPGGKVSIPSAISCDNKSIVGWSESETKTEAFVWDGLKGMRNLQSVLTNEYHLNLTGWTLTKAKGISTDGMVIVGDGKHAGHVEAWIAHLDQPLNTTSAKK